MKTRKLYMLCDILAVSCPVLILHYNELLGSPTATRFDQTFDKGLLEMTNFH